MGRNPQILLIIEGTYPWYRGGVSEWVYQYLNHLPDFDFHILQVATDEFQDADPKQALYPLTGNVVNFVRVSPPEDIFNWESAKQEWYLSINSSLGSLEYDLIHVANTGFAGWLGAQISQKSQVPLVLTEHAIYWKEVEKGAVALECGYQIPETKELKQEMVKMFQDLARETYQASDKVISVSKVNIAEQKKLGALQPEYIPNGISNDLLIGEKSRGPRPTIGWIGRCAEMKRPELFFKIVDSFDSIGMKADFVMMLSDANEKDLEEEIKKLSLDHPDVRMIWNEDAKEYISGLDFLCITSHNESQPLVMFEALSKKALPFGWEVGDVNSNFAYVVDSGTSTIELASQIKELWNNSVEFEKMVEEKYSLLKEDHLWNKIFARYRSLFLEYTADIEVIA